MKPSVLSALVPVIVFALAMVNGARADDATALTARPPPEREETRTAARAFRLHTELFEVRSQAT